MFAHSVFDPVSPQGLAISNLFIILMLIAVLIIALIVGVLVITALRFRQRPGQGDPPQTFGLRRLELVWTAIPLVIVLGLFGASVKTMQIAAPPNDNSAVGHAHPDITVVGHQWWWEIRYRSGVVTANEMHIPLHTRLLVALQSADVLHSLWIPQLNGKLDLVPGQTNYIWLEADRSGTYTGACAEFCGVAHPYMLIRVIAQPGAAFSAWQRQQLTPPPPPANAEEAAGAQIYQHFTCQACHGASDIGPSLAHLGTRQTLAAWTLANTPAHLEAWLRDPQAIKPGNHMPNFQFTTSEIRALTAYLEAQR
jgi:cytochrome c oxidase subunit 2